jgi:hypothetical protein
MQRLGPIPTHPIKKENWPAFVLNGCWIVRKFALRSLSPTLLNSTHQSYHFYRSSRRQTLVTSKWEGQIKKMDFLASNRKKSGLCTSFWRRMSVLEQRCQDVGLVVSFVCTSWFERSGFGGRMRRCLFSSGKVARFIQPRPDYTGRPPKEFRRNAAGG